MSIQNWPFNPHADLAAIEAMAVERGLLARVRDLLMSNFSFESDVRLSEIRATALAIPRLEFTAEEVASDLFHANVEHVYAHIYTDWPHGVPGESAIGNLIYD